ncbi:PIN domain-containing protein [bacterium]|nr:PIN domain-containing protein [candidate division CSSED10-310 bacterium]
MSYLIDTCVISELAASHPDNRVVNWIDSIDPEFIYLSVITIGEIEKGIQKLSEPKRKLTFAQWLQDDLLTRFEGRIVFLDTAILLEWGD